MILITDTDDVTFVEKDIGGMRGGIGSFVQGEDRIFRFQGNPPSP